MPRIDLDSIFQVEMTEKRLTLGEDFYNSLIGDKIETNTAVEYAAGTEYEVDDLVFFEGILYKSTSATNSTEPGTKGKWITAPKFKTDANNNLWCMYLGRYLSLHVIDRTIPAQSTQLSGSGTIKVNGDNFKSADEKSVVRMQSSVLRLISETFDNMDYYLKSNESSFSLYLGLSKTSDSDCDESCSNDSEFYDQSCIDGNRPVLDYDNRNRYNGNIYRLG